MSGARVLIIGSGGREHVLAWKMAMSNHVEEIFVAPGNPGCEDELKVTCIDLNVSQNDTICKWCEDNKIDLVVVGPEAPLANGLANSLKAKKIPCFGPSKEAAQLESNKQYAKVFMARNEILTARWKSFTDSQLAKLYIKSNPEGSLVVKASGLAAGKGVIVAETHDEACRAVDNIMQDKIFGTAGDVVVIEDRLQGEEVSVLAFTDGKTVSLMPPSQDHKRLKEGDEGPNTGGMGAYCPCDFVDTFVLKDIQENILEKVVRGLAKEKIEYVGVVYAGLMLTSNGPYVLEFNCRFGDPEAEVILPLLKSDLYLTMKSCVDGWLANMSVVWDESLYSCGVMMASKGYPESAEKGQPITGVESINDCPQTKIFQAGTKRGPVEGQLLTNGGRVLIVVASADTLCQALTKALKGVDKICFDGSQHRRDIGARQIQRQSLPTLTYAASGVDIKEGDYFVDLIRPLVETTRVPGVVEGIGGFGGLFDLSMVNYKHPVLVSGTDGVGTKLKIACAVNKHETIGIDLVAMCVNDVLTHGAQPLFFLDYLSCSRLNALQARQIIEGVVRGCHMAKCALLGGETAEMPGVYMEGDYDVAGFTVGVAERSLLLPRTKDIKNGDDVIGIASSGVHSNGFSLVRSVISKTGIRLDDVAPFDPTRSLGDALLTPTKIYVGSLLPLLQKEGTVKAAAHITGGGITGNLRRILPASIGAKLDATKWELQPIFGWIAAEGNVANDEMLKTFNCGIGMILVTDPEKTVEVLKNLEEYGEKAWRIGSTCRDKSKTVYVEKIQTALHKSYLRPGLHREYTDEKPIRVAVLISGTGTNLQALINAFEADNRSNIRIRLVISNVPAVKGLERARKANIASKVISHRDYTSRVDFDMAMDAALREAEVDIVCLAGFMRILTGEFVRRWHGKLLNIHPSLLPSFKGLHPHKQAIEAGVRVTGCTVHFVVEEVDAGGIIAQEVVPVLPTDTEEVLQERVKLAEHRAYPRALELVALGQVKLRADGTLLWSSAQKMKSR